MRSDEENTLVKVQLQDEHQQASAALNALERIGVKAALVRQVPANGHPAAIVLQVPREQLAEAICSLQYFGFGCVETQSVSVVFAPTHNSNPVTGGL
jgi:hypothetical protein